MFPSMHDHFSHGHFFGLANPTETPELGNALYRDSRECTFAMILLDYSHTTATKSCPQISLFDLESFIGGASALSGLVSGLACGLGCSMHVTF